MSGRHFVLLIFGGFQTYELRSEAGKPFVSKYVDNLDHFWRKSRKIEIWTSLEYLEKELEALLWICFSLVYILLIFEEKFFPDFFFTENFFIEIFFPTQKIEKVGFSSKNRKIENHDFGQKIIQKIRIFFFDEKIFDEKKVEKKFSFKNQ